MKTIEINSVDKSYIYIGESYKNLTNYINSENIVIITDSNLYEIYGSFLSNYKTVVIQPGESHKNLDTVRQIYNQLVTMHVDRSWFIVGFGGGIVCDITGYVATTYMRGLSFGFVSTSLLSQVDASTGGKNGVNFMGAKNMIGTFSQPEFVICDPEVLYTLPDDEFENGWAEIIKHAIIASVDMFKYLEDKYDTIKSRDKDAITHLIYESVKIKSEVVSKDEKEHGERRKLNFGHTLGHAIEVIEGISHGRAVAIGMTMAIKLSVEHKFINQEQADRCIKLIEKYNLPTQTSIEPDKLIEKVNMDKKKSGESISFILIDRIGNAVIKEIELNEIVKSASKHLIS
ncbi:MAG: 3-dehydroquinate synthase [Bacteroidales bacterium]|jgi:3-dehydroquinate synthase|nr:3-dehydroquinate synthase [Bacteroidales bacterium]